MSQFEKNIWGPGFCAFLYLIVHFIPDFGGADVMGSQWLYVSVVDFAILSYILFNQQQYKAAIFFFGGAGLLIDFATNAIYKPTEPKK